MKKWWIGVIIVGSLASFLFAQELLQNPGYESWTGGMPEYWVNETGGFAVIQESVVVHDGNYSAKLILNSTSTQRFAQYVASVSPGVGYKFSFYVIDNDLYGRVRVAMRWYDGSGNFLGGYYGDYSIDSPEWQFLSSGAQVAPLGAESLHVEIRLYDVDWPPGESAVFYIDDASLIEVTTPQFPELTIEEIQGHASTSPWEDSIVTTCGIVTGVFGNNFFIEEQPGGAWHGIFINRGGTGVPPVAVGDSVLITGIVDEYGGLTKLKNLIELIVIASGVNVPGPTLLPTGAVPSEEYEGTFVKVDESQCVDDSLGYGEWLIDDLSGPVRVDDMGISFIPVLGNYYMVQGPLYYSLGNFKIEPRDSNDIFDYGPTLVKEKDTEITPHIILLGNPVIGNITFLLTLMNPAEVKLSLYDIRGRLVEGLKMGTLNTGTHKIVLNGKRIPSGTYFFKLTAGKKESTGCFVLFK